MRSASPESSPRRCSSGLAAVGNESGFTWVLVPALLSDIADGLVARLFHLQSRLGALLDSIADTLLLFASVYGIWVFHPDVVAHHCWRPRRVSVSGCWRTSRPGALWPPVELPHLPVEGRRLLLGIFVGVLFVFGFQPWLLHAAVGVSVLGNLEELVLLALLPEWRCRCRGLVGPARATHWGAQ